MSCSALRLTSKLWAATLRYGWSYSYCKIRIVVTQFERPPQTIASLNDLHNRRLFPAFTRSTSSLLLLSCGGHWRLHSSPRFSPFWHHQGTTANQCATSTKSAGNTVDYSHKRRGTWCVPWTLCINSTPIHFFYSATRWLRISVFRTCWDWDVDYNCHHHRYHHHYYQQQPTTPPIARPAPHSMHCNWSFHRQCCCFCCQSHRCCSDTDAIRRSLASSTAKKLPPRRSRYSYHSSHRISRHVVAGMWSHGSPC